MNSISKIVIAAALSAASLTAPSIASAQGLGSALGGMLSNSSSISQLTSLLSSATSIGGVESTLTEAQEEGYSATDMATALGAAASTSDTPDMYETALGWLAEQTGVDQSMLQAAFDVATGSSVQDAATKAFMGGGGSSNSSGDNPMNAIGGMFGGN